MLDAVRRRANARGRREQLFVEVFAALHARYQQRLAADGEIDFHAMIRRAAELVEEGGWRSPYRWILVDELQDLAAARLRLVRALIASAPETRTFCVGDDCQSIYRFAGSDVGLMTRFEEHRGFARRVELDRSFRVNDRLLAVAVRFVGRNPGQLAKRIEAHERRDRPAVEIRALAAATSLDESLAGVLGEIRAEMIGIGCDRASVLLLGRYQHLEPEILPTLCARFSELDLRFLTVHGSKGLEADFVVILGMESGRFGLPCEISDDPLLDLVLSGPESFPYAEERRLFFVALTRARRKVWLLGREDSPSSFVIEIEGWREPELIAGDRARTSRLLCPECQADTLTPRTGAAGRFWGCLNYPYCQQSFSACHVCGEGALLPGDDGEGACTHPSCAARARRCPRCRTGLLIPREGSFGACLGCSGFWRLPPCEYTESV